jgi:hypothetical protein
MKTNGGVEIWLYRFLFYALDRINVQPHSPVAFILKKCPQCSLAMSFCGRQNQYESYEGRSATLFGRPAHGPVAIPNEVSKTAHVRSRNSKRQDFVKHNLHTAKEYTFALLSQCTNGVWVTNKYGGHKRKLNLF